MEAKRMHDVETRPPRRQSKVNGSGPDSDAQEQSSDEVTALLARRLGYVFVRDLSEFPVDPSAFEMVPWKAIRRQRAIPLGFDGNDLIVAVADPTNVIGLDDIRTMSGRNLKVIVARGNEIDEMISRFDQLDRSAQDFLEEAAKDHEDEEEQLNSVDNAPIVKAINRIISQAVQQRASDIHIEPEDSDVRIRYRIDGVLTEAMRTKKSLHGGITTRRKDKPDLAIAG